jgi:hypothetical protein
VNWKQKQAGKGHIIVHPTRWDAPQNTKVTDKRQSGTALLQAGSCISTLLEGSKKQTLHLNTPTHRNIILL